jgi:drug/metabolite transporter (DMT)-like permease
VTDTAPFRLSVEPIDRHSPTTIIGAAGLLAGVVMAVLGLPPVDLHGPLHHLGIMDPFCGGTRAAYYTLRGQGGQAWRYNPLGMLAVLAASVAVARAAAGMVTRRWVNLTVTWSPARRRAMVAAVLMAAAALEVRQQMIAPLLMTPLVPAQ